MTIKKYIKNHTGISTLIAFLVVIVMIIGGRVASRKPAESTGSNTRQVMLVEATTFRDDLSTVSVDGIVESVSQADVKSQFSAPIAAVYAEVGDNVGAGETIAELQNADIRAQLEQARANLSLVKGQDSTGTGDSVRRSTYDKIQENYIKADDVINTQIGQFLFVNNSTQKQLQQSVSDWRLAQDLSTYNDAKKNAFKLWQDALAGLSESSSKEQLQAALKVSQKSLAVMSDFLNVVSLAVTNRTQSAASEDQAMIAGWRAVVTNARSAISTAISSLSAAETSLSSSDSQIKVAEAGVKNLEAQLAKTVITSPISGKIAALPLRVGEFVSAGQLVMTVVGPGGLQLKAFASSEDIGRIAKNARVTIQGNISGIVDSVAPSVSQLNKRVEVKIIIPAGEKSNLVVGQSVQAKIQVTNATAVSTGPVSYMLPIQNVKILPGEAFVYTLDAESKVVKNKVTLGAVKGDYVEVKDGMTDDMEIISPVYELEEGEIVKI